MTIAAGKPWTAAGTGIKLRVRLTPKSSRDHIEGIEEVADGPALKARVRAVPEDGKANAAIAALVADLLAVPKRTVTVTAGQKSRIKTLSIAGNTAELGRRIEAATANIMASTRQQPAKEIDVQTHRRQSHRRGRPPLSRN